MKIFDLIKNRRTIHSFSGDAVSDETFRHAIEAAVHAPNHHLTWPWFFIRVENKKREQLADLHVRLKSTKSPMTEVAKAATRAKILEPPILLMAGIKKPDASARTYSDQTKEDYASLACAIQNMALYLWSENVGLKWSTGGLIRSPETYSLLGISPETHEIAGVIFIGYPKATPNKPERPASDQFYWSVR